MLLNKQIYVYIHRHQQTDCFVVSQLISVARHAGRFKLGLKPTQLYVRLSIVLLIHKSTNVSSGIIRHYIVAFVCLHFALLDTRVLNSYEDLCIIRVAAVNSFARVLNPRVGEPIYCHTLTRILDWRFCQPGFDHCFGNLACLATLKSCDTTKQSVCGWQYIYIYIYKSHVFFWFVRND